MSLDTTLNTISISDVITLLNDPRFKNDDAIWNFASDLTGLSIDGLWELMYDAGYDDDEGYEDDDGNSAEPACSRDPIKALGDLVRADVMTRIKERFTATGSSFTPPNDQEIFDAISKSEPLMEAYWETVDRLIDQQEKEALPF